MTNYVQVVLELTYRKIPKHGVAYHHSQLKSTLEYYKNIHLPKPAIEGMIRQKIPFIVKKIKFSPTCAEYESVDIRGSKGLLKLYFRTKGITTPAYVWRNHKTIINEGFLPKCKDAKFLDKNGEFAVESLVGSPYRLI